MSMDYKTKQEIIEALEFYGDKDNYKKEPILSNAGYEGHSSSMDFDTGEKAREILHKYFSE